ncbi:MAG: Ribosomal silencing factor RsfS [Chloroflexi bacterium ADurb.Bin180]|nr:MAG: Ribosomal silencing factor RsfS [Chloroflexi bacterium ADurb.Bin180]HNR95490.1 ribosome silencing factor [Anaerolineae bacterium]HNT04807.1 ribosome silencing factor [Anaerolineae bacterium]HOU23983.1 ribosome silencing factor [Anaerolineae bacterium]HQJ50927.1 ribosome silencing factor [Anaerolineae bacterium]
MDAAVAKMGEDVLLLDIRGLSSFADYFVVCSGASQKQLHALAEEIRAKTRASGATLIHSEGSPASGWLLLDYGSVVVHIFSAPTRQYYNLEQLWKDARTVVRLL